MVLGSGSDDEKKKKLALRWYAKAVPCRAACRHTSESICAWREAEVALMEWRSREEMCM